MTTEQKGVVVVKDGETSVVPAQADDPFALIAMAVQRGDVGVDTVRELMALQREMKAARAEEAFVRSMAALQAELPVIERRKPVYGKEGGGGKPRYHYAPMDDLVRIAGPLIAKHGFSYDFDTAAEGGAFTAKCVVTHMEGHTRTRQFSIPIGAEQYMTEAQKFGARATYAKRNAFCNAFGITTGDEDNDDADTHERREPPRRIDQPTGEVMSDEAMRMALERFAAAGSKDELRSALENARAYAIEIGDVDARKRLVAEAAKIAKERFPEDKV